MNILVFDTETISIDKPFCYNIGYIIYNTDKRQKVIERDFVVEQVWHNPMLFSTAYYFSKKDIYIRRMRAKLCIMEKYGYITQQMIKDIKAHEVQRAYAFNSPFDVNVFAFNCDWFKVQNPFDNVAVHDIRGFVHQFIAFTDDFQQFCEEQGRFTESGNYSTTAETVFQYLAQDPNFEEEHTALSDSDIECDILMHCIDLGADFDINYRVRNSIPRKVNRIFQVVATDGIIHNFPYHTKVKLKNEDGFRLRKFE